MKVKTKMKTKTNLKSGSLLNNHNETLAARRRA